MILLLNMFGNELVDSLISVFCSFHSFIDVIFVAVMDISDQPAMEVAPIELLRQAANCGHLARVHELLSEGATLDKDQVTVSAALASPSECSCLMSAPTVHCQREYKVVMERTRHSPSYARHSFTVAGHSIWNSPPRRVCNCPTAPVVCSKS